MRIIGLIRRLSIVGCWHSCNKIMGLLIISVRYRWGNHIGWINKIQKYFHGYLTTHEILIQILSFTNNANVENSQHFITSESVSQKTVTKNNRQLYLNQEINLKYLVIEY
jgi:hypothetical protein